VSLAGNGSRQRSTLEVKELLRWFQFTPQNDCLTHDQGQHSLAISTLSLSPLVGEPSSHQRFTGKLLLFLQRSSGK
jgi:hypothetical protein